ncbi:hypothetical protein F4604DRAFT_1699174 [Suillus subluteus]|nr:hypothetical protein F4604DRAFT_1699174 [Suillus subluteus]
MMLMMDSASDDKKCPPASNRYCQSNKSTAPHSESCNSHVLGPVDVNFPEPHIHRLPVEHLNPLTSPGCSWLLLTTCQRNFTLGGTTIPADFASLPLVFTWVCHYQWRVVAHPTAEISSAEKLLAWIEVRSSVPVLAKIIVRTQGGYRWTRSGGRDNLARIEFGRISISERIY